MLMKDGLDQPAIERMIDGLGKVVDDFDADNFHKDAMNGLHELELKDRVRHLIEVLHCYLPERFSDTAKCLKRLPPVWDRGDPKDPIRGFAAWPIIDYVGVYGIAAPKTALPLLATLTPLFSAEFAIRPFLIEHQALTFEYMNNWVSHRDEHVRRLVSEGARPRLPWGVQLTSFVQNPQPCLPLLEKLKDDESEYVRRSVANHLNDIGKDHPDLLVSICKKWQKQKLSPEEDSITGRRKWVISHATRSLVKAGHPSVFALLGYSASPKIRVDEFSLASKRVKLGGSLRFNFSLTGEKPKQKFVLDYAVHYRKANGSTAPKVFKLKNIALEKGESIVLEKRISFKKITTRKFYAGVHYVALHVNGVEIARREFDVLI